MSNISRKIKKNSPKKNIQATNDQNSSVVYATYLDRIKAFITDLFMIYTPILYAITYVVLGSKEAFQNSNSAPFVAVVLYGVIYALFIAKTGQTPGKKAYKIKVVDANSYQTISLFRAFLRFVFFLVGATFVIGAVLPMFRKDKKAFHDLMVKTIVIAV